MMQEMLVTKMDVSIGYLKIKRVNSSLIIKKCYTPKTVKSPYGKIEMDIPRNRNGK